MIAAVKRLLDDRGVTWIQSPSEADPQLVYQVRTNLADIIITEDIDVLAFDSRLLTESENDLVVLTKLDGHGTCLVMNTKSLYVRGTTKTDQKTSRFSQGHLYTSFTLQSLGGATIGKTYTVMHLRKPYGW